MAVSHDTSAESHSGTSGSVSESSFSINITIAAGAKGVWCGVATYADADNITSVDIDGGGGALTQFSEAVDTAGEPMRATVFFLADPPTGARIITVTRTNNATTMYAVAHSVIASSAVEVYTPGIVLLQGDGTVVEQNVDDGSPGTNSLRFAFLSSGRSAALGAGANSNVGQGILISPSLWTVRSYYEAIAGQGSRPVGGETTTSDDRAGVYFAIREVPTGVSGTIGQSLETDSAFGAVPLRAVALSLAAETDTGQTLVPRRTKPVGLVAEADSAFGMAPLRAEVIGLTTEADSSFPFVPLRTVAINIAQETDSGLAMTASLAGSIGIATESDSAFGMTGAKAQAISIALESDSAFGIGIRRVVLVGIGTEADTAFAMAHANQKAVGQAQETDSAMTMLVLRVPVIGLALETDTAFAFTMPGSVSVLLGNKVLRGGYSTIVTLKGMGALH